MRILLVSNHFSQLKGGSEYQAFLYSQELIRAGYDVAFLAYNPEGTTYDETLGGIPIYHCGPSGWMKKIPILKNGDTRYFSVLRYRRILEEFHPDAILQIGESSITGILVMFGGARNIPFIWICASDRSLKRVRFHWKSPLGIIGDLLMKYGIHHANKHFLQNTEQINAFRKSYPDEEVDIFPNLQPIYSGIKPKEKTKYILWVANLKPMKRPEAFIDLAEGFANRTDIRFIMVGRSNYVNIENIRFRITGLPNMEYLGELSQEDVNTWLVKAFLLVNTSEYEGFSNTFVQAWMRSTPVVTLSVNPSHIFDNEKVGGCACGDPRKLHGIIEFFLRDQTAYDEYSKYCRKYAVEHHAPEKVFPKLLSCIKELCQSSQ